MPNRFRITLAALVAVLATAGTSIARPTPRLAGVRVAGIAPSSVSVVWRQPRSGRARVELFVNGRRIAIVRGRRFTFSSLACKTRYRLTLRARDARGRHSRRVWLFVTTAACAGPDPGDKDEGEAPPPIPTPVVPSPAAPPTAVDSQAPSTPGGLAIGKVTATSIPFSWKASNDNVGIARYAVYLNGTQILPPSPTATTYTFTGLTCGTSYMLGVQAFDPSGNASSIATQSAATSACPAPAPTPAPAPAPAPAPQPSGNCPSNPLVGVQRPGQLTVLDGSNPCRTATGTVFSTHVEHDGDCHVNLTPDSGSSGLMNGVNRSAAHGTLITEVIPSHTLPIPNVGSRVTIFGTWVNDKATGWNELHAVWSISVQSGGNGSCGG
ncbi:MAG TPA: fibronectin type III domain-containing protein [Solirubrobacteraceae bacterium]|jgi:chitodextrinase